MTILIQPPPGRRAVGGRSRGARADFDSAQGGYGAPVDGCNTVCILQNVLHTDEWKDR